MTVDVIGGGLETAVAADVMALVRAAAWDDGAEPLGEASLLALTHGQGAAVHAVARLDGQLAGYAQLDPATGTVELVVAPPSRRRGIGGALVRALRDEASRAGGPELRIWSHADLPAARAFADALGMTSVRELWLMRRPLTPPTGLGLFDLAGSLGSVGAADAVVGSESVPDEQLRPFVPGRDEDAWVALNRLAFATHPEQGRLGRADLEARMAEDWWDPAGLLLAGPAHNLAGFVWTKLTADASGSLVGEIYVLAVNPAHQGRGLGGRLLRAGLDSMAARGAAWAVLYVESDNLPALRLYRQAGFAIANRDIQYAF